MYVYFTIIHLQRISINLHSSHIQDIERESLMSKDNPYEMDDPYLSIFKDQSQNSQSLLFGVLPKKPSYGIERQNMIFTPMNSFNMVKNGEYNFQMIEGSQKMVDQQANKEQFAFQKNYASNQQSQVKREQDSMSKGNGSQKSKQKNSKSRSKVFYRDKVAQLTNDQNYQKQAYNYIDYAKSSRGRSPISRDQQLKRNRQSAKLSRQRKKQYVQLLEDKNNEKDRKIEELTMKIRALQFERDQLRQDTIAKRKNFLTEKAAAYTNLSDKIKCQLTSDIEIKNSLDYMIKHYGAAGDQRIATTNVYFREIIDILIGDIHKYIIHCAITNKGLFGVGKWDSLDSESASILGITKQKRSILSNKFNQRLITQANLFKDLTQQFHNIYQSIQSQARVIQNIFNDIRGQFSNRSLASLIVWLEQNKFRKQIKKLRTFWMDLVQGKDSTQQQNQRGGSIRKQSKLSDD